MKYYKTLDAALAALTGTGSVYQTIRGYTLGKPRKPLAKYEYFDAGKLRREYEYDADGKLVRARVYEDGQLRRECVYDNDRELRRVYECVYEDGKISCEYKYGKLEAEK